MKQKLFFTFALCIVLSKLFSQVTEYSYYGSSVTPKGDLHTLIVFIGLDDATSADDYDNWDYNDLPEWAKGDYNEVIDKDNSQIHTVKNNTSYMNRISNGNFRVTGEIYPNLILVDPDYTSFVNSSGDTIYSLNLLQVYIDAKDILNTQSNPNFNYVYN